MKEVVVTFTISEDGTVKWKVDFEPGTEVPWDIIKCALRKTADELKPQ